MNGGDIKAVQGDSGHAQVNMVTDVYSHILLKYLSLFKERQVDGVIFIATMFTRKHKQMLKDYKVPIVLLGQYLDGYPCIYQDDYKAAFLVTEKLAQKGNKFGYIGVTDKDEAVGTQRREGFEAALHKNKLEAVPERMKIGNFTMDSGYEMAKELFEEDPSIDSLVCATDTMAVGAMTYLKEIGLRIPEIGFLYLQESQRFR